MKYVWNRTKEKIRARRTVVCHFYNEEYLFPWWLRHHRRIFDHGIMIDYRSTDKSRELINRFCPGWEIHESRNAFFDSAAVDREVEDHEARCDGWRITLNVTEFLYGNLRQLDHVFEPTQLFLGNYVFLDPADGSRLDQRLPLHVQRTFGYWEDDPAAADNLHLGKRASRSLHNFALRYPEQGGRHWRDRPTIRDLAIFYYGYADLSEPGLRRKLQIAGQMSQHERETLPIDHPNLVTRDTFTEKIEKYHRPRSGDLSRVVRRFARHHKDVFPAPD